MSTTVVVMGVSGSGKSTLAASLVARTGWDFQEGDDLHSDAARAAMAAGRPLTDADRLPWLGRIAAWIGEHEAAGRSAVVTCSALRRAYRDVLRDGHPSVRFLHPTLPPEELARRLRERRGHYMPASLLASQLDTLEPLGPDEPGATVETTGDPAAVADEAVRRLGLDAVTGA